MDMWERDDMSHESVPMEANVAFVSIVCCIMDGRAVMSRMAASSGGDEGATFFAILG